MVNMRCLLVAGKLNYLMYFSNNILSCLSKKDTRKLSKLKFKVQMNNNQYGVIENNDELEL